MISSISALISQLIIAYANFKTNTCMSSKKTNFNVKRTIWLKGYQNNSCKK